MIKSVMKVLLGDKQARDMKKIMPLVAEINQIAAEYEDLDDETLRNKTADFRKLLRAVPRITRVGEVAVFRDQAAQFLERHPDVERAFFLGTRRDFHPASLVAFVIPKEGVEASEDLATQIREGMTRLSEEHKPEKVIFVDAFIRDEEDKHNDEHQMMRIVEEAELPEWGTFTIEELAKKLPEEEQVSIEVEDILPEAFAAVKEACRRHVGKEWTAAGADIKWNMVPFDVQLAGGVALAKGKIAELARGEGKTRTAIMPR